MEGRNALLEKLKASPDAVLLINELQETLDAEKKEREKFYALVHEDCKAEFINGKIIFQSPVKMRHWKVSMRLSALLHDFVTKQQLGVVGVEKVMIKLTRNDYDRIGEPTRHLLFLKGESSTFHGGSNAISRSRFRSRNYFSFY